jgi:hypothetical protein
LVKHPINYNISLFPYLGLEIDKSPHVLVWANNRFEMKPINYASAGTKTQLHTSITGAAIAKTSLLRHGSSKFLRRNLLLSLLLFSKTKGTEYSYHTPPIPRFFEK